MPNEHVGLEPQRLLAPGRVGAMPIRAKRPLAGNAAVVERGLAHQIDLDTAVDALGGPNKRVIGILVRWRPGVGCHRVLPAARSHRQRVAHHHPTRRRLPRRHHRVGPRLVDPVTGDVDPERAEPEPASSAVEQGTEHARRVEPRDAQPVDRAVRGHERARVAVGQEAVVGNRSERGRRCRALRHRSVRDSVSRRGCGLIHARSVSAGWVTGRHTSHVI